MEKIKNFFYDISDLLFSLLLIAIIFFVVSWKLSDTMKITWFSKLTGQEKEVELNESLTAVDDIGAVNDLSPVVTDEPEDNTQVVDINPIDTTTVDINTDVTELEPEVIDTEPIETEIKDISFVIKSGTPGYKIASNLKEQGLIADKDEFLRTLESMKLGSKLRAGTFDLNTGMSVEEIINELTGNK